MDASRYLRRFSAHIPSSLLLLFGIPAQALFDVVVQSEIQLLRREPVVPRPRAGSSHLQFAHVVDVPAADGTQIGRFDGRHSHGSAGKRDEFDFVGRAIFMDHAVTA